MKSKMMAALTLAMMVTGTAIRAEPGNETDQGSSQGESDEGSSQAKGAQGSILVRNEGGYTARFSVAYNPSGAGKRVKKERGKFSIGAQKAIAIPAGAKDIYVKVEENTGFQWSTIFTKEFDAPKVKCYKVYGTTLNPKHKTMSCP